MARDPKDVHASLLVEAIERARPLLRWPINRVDLKRSLIRVGAAGECVFFYVNVEQSGQIDGATGHAFPIAEGESYELVLVTKGRRAEAEASWREGEPSTRQPWWRKILAHGL